MVDPLKESHPQVDDTLIFGHTDVMYGKHDVVEFDNIAETAFVVPINKTRTEVFPCSIADKVEAYFVLRPRST